MRGLRNAGRLRRALRLVDRDERLSPETGWHPSPSELTAYRDHRLPHRRAARIQRHLGTCFDCPDLLLDLERFLATPDRENGDRDPSWEELRPYLFKPAAQQPASQTGRFVPIVVSVRTAYAVAAASLLAAVALALWSSFPRPQANVAVVSLEMPGIYRGPDVVQEVRLRPDAELVVLLISSGFEGEGALRLDILDQDDRPLGFLSGLRADAGEVHVSLPRGDLPAGSLRLRLSGGGFEETMAIQVLHL